ncbi:hypothetical protein [Streptomyces sp. NPDC097619]|uniref:hypothetical protein n=1 Tax=Streptomyces sp. NPDC097619 TaxID=3157228 RepID=UPI00331CF474
MHSACVIVRGGSGYVTPSGRRPAIDGDSQEGTAAFAIPERAGTIASIGSFPAAVPTDGTTPRHPAPDARSTPSEGTATPAGSV